MMYTKSIKGKLYYYFKQRLQTKPSTKGWERCDCMYCGGKFTYGINIKNFKSHCFKCGEWRSPLDLLMELEGFDTIIEVRKFLSIQQEYEAYDKLLGSTKPQEYEEVELPKGFKLVGMDNSLLCRSATNYLKLRGFKVEDLIQRGVGYCDDGEYWGYVVFPFYSRGKLVFYQGRRFISSAGPKMRNVESERFGIGKTQVIYNEEALYIYNKVWVVESITNNLTIGDNAIATLGKSISSYQRSHIIGSPCKSIVIGLDEDAYLEALVFAMQIVPYKRVKVLQFPEGKDINDLGKKESRRIEKETNYSSYTELLQKKLEHEGKVALYAHKERPSSYNFKRGAS